MDFKDLCSSSATLRKDLITHIIKEKIDIQSIKVQDSMINLYYISSMINLYNKNKKDYVCEYVYFFIKDKMNVMLSNGNYGFFSIREDETKEHRVFLKSIRQFSKNNEKEWYEFSISDYTRKKEILNTIICEYPNVNELLLKQNVDKGNVIRIVTHLKFYNVDNNLIFDLLFSIFVLDILHYLIDVNNTFKEQVINNNNEIIMEKYSCYLHNALITFNRFKLEQIKSRDDIDLFLKNNPNPDELKDYFVGKTAYNQNIQFVKYMLNKCIFPNYKFIRWDKLQWIDSSFVFIEKKHYFLWENDETYVKFFKEAIKDYKKNKRYKIFKIVVYMMFYETMSFNSFLISYNNPNKLLNGIIYKALENNKNINSIITMDFSNIFSYIEKEEIKSFFINILQSNLNEYIKFLLVKKHLIPYLNWANINISLTNMLALIAKFEYSHLEGYRWEEICLAIVKELYTEKKVKYHYVLANGKYPDIVVFENNCIKLIVECKISDYFFNHDYEDELSMIIRTKEYQCYKPFCEKLLFFINDFSLGGSKTHCVKYNSVELYDSCSIIENFELSKDVVLMINKFNSENPDIINIAKLINDIDSIM